MEWEKWSVSMSSVLPSCEFSLVVISSVRVPSVIEINLLRVLLSSSDTGVGRSRKVLHMCVASFWIKQNRNSFIPEKIINLIQLFTSRASPCLQIRRILIHLPRDRWRNQYSPSSFGENPIKVPPKHIKLVVHNHQASCTVALRKPVYDKVFCELFTYRTRCSGPARASEHRRRPRESPCRS